MESPEIYSHDYEQQIFNKLERQFNKGQFFQQIVLEKLDVHIPKINFHLNLTFYTKIKLKWIMNKNVKAKTIKKNQQKIQEKNTCDLGVAKGFLATAPKVQSIKGKPINWTSLKLKLKCDLFERHH